MSEIADILARHSHGEITTSALPRLTIVGCQTPTPPVPVIFNPAFCLVAKGRNDSFSERKRITTILLVFSSPRPIYRSADKSLKHPIWDSLLLSILCYWRHCCSRCLPSAVATRRRKRSRSQKWKANSWIRSYVCYDFWITLDIFRC